MPRFYLRAPNPAERRKTFRIYKEGHPLVEPRIEALNALYGAGEVDLEVATLEAKKILRQLKDAEKEAARRDTFPDANLDVLERATADYGRRKVGQKSRRVAIAGMRRCLSLLGKAVLHSAKVEDLQSLLDKQPHRAQPKIAVYLNVLLGHAGREERVLVPAQPDPDVHYLTREELSAVLKALSPEHRLPIITAFVTGCRLGEVFGLQRMGRQASVHIARQLFEDGTYGPPKWSKPGSPKARWAPVMEWGRDSVREWIGVLEGMDEDKKLAFRGLEWATIVRTACQAAFPKRPHKHLSFRDVRHCYAIYWLDRGATLRHVAQSMGNSESVVRKHYSGFIQTDEAEQAMLSLEKKNG